MADKDFSVKNGIVVNTSFSANSSGVYFSNVLLANSSTVNATNFTGTSNNSSYLGGTIAASYQLNSTLSANVAKLSANNTTYVNTKTEGNLNVNSASYATSAGSATNATYATSAGSATNATTTSQTIWTNLYTTSQLNSQGNQSGSIITATSSLGGIMVQGPGTINGAYMSFHRPGAYAAYFGLDTDNQFAVGGWSAGAALANMKVGSLGVGTAASGTAGEIRAIDNITAYYSSDISLKENITKIKNSLEKVSKINGYEYDWTDEYIKSRGGEDGYFIRKHDIGVIAQEIEKVLPEVVSERENGIKAVKYERIVALLIEAIKELSDKVDILENRVK